MARFNAREITWEKVRVLEQEGLFTELRVDRSTIPEGWYMYEVRHDDNNWGDPVEIARGILVNHFGTLLVKDPIELEPFQETGNDYRYIDPEKDWYHFGETEKFEEGA